MAIIVPRTILLVILLCASFIHPTIATDGEENDGPRGFSEQQEDILSTAALESRVERAHGIIGTVTFALLFPLGGIFLRLLPGRLAVLVHAIWQLLALCLALVTLGMGVWLAEGTAYIETYHAIIGIVVVASVCVQPVTGWLHHRLFKKSGTRGAASYLHKYWGIGAITLGTINGGFGLQLAGAENKYVIVYAVLAALVWVIWMGISVVSQCFGGLRRKKAANGQMGSTKELAPDGEAGKPSIEVRETSTR